jgi:hypothetical protein
MSMDKTEVHHIMPQQAPISNLAPSETAALTTSLQPTSRALETLTQVTDAQNSSHVVSNMSDTASNSTEKKGTSDVTAKVDNTDTPSDQISKLDPDQKITQPKRHRTSRPRNATHAKQHSQRTKVSMIY